MKEILNIDLEKQLNIMTFKIDFMYTNQAQTQDDPPEGKNSLDVSGSTRKKTNMDCNVQIYKIKLDTK